MKRPIALLASLLAVTVLATAAAAAGGDSSDPLISLNYLQTTFTTKATSSIDAALDKADQAAYAKAEAALRSTIAAAEANVGAQRADVFTESRLKQGDVLSGTTARSKAARRSRKITAISSPRTRQRFSPSPARPRS